MDLDEYSVMEGPGALTRLQHKTGLAYTTILRAKQQPVRSYETARKISEATGGLVTIEELCGARTRGGQPWNMLIRVERNAKGEFAARLVDGKGEAEIRGYTSAHQLLSALGHVVATRADGRQL